VRRWWLRHDGGVVSAACVCSATVSTGLGGVYGVVVDVVLVYPEAGDGLGLRAHSVERHGRNSRVRRRAGENRALTVGVVGDRMVVQWRVVAV